MWIRIHTKLRADAYKIEEDQTRTERPVKVEEHDIDFRVPGLSHAVVKEAEHLRVQELVKKIENHHHRVAFQADLQQNNVYNPLSKNSKAMISELGNVELFELCETVQCSNGLLYWNQGIVYCTCGQFLIDSESRRKFTKLRLDALSIPNYVIKKGRCHGARYGRTEEQKEYHSAWNAWKRCCKKVDSQGGHLQVFTIDSSEIQLSWITTRNRMDRTKVQRVGRTCKRRPYVSSHSRGKEKIPRTMVSHLEQIRQKWAMKLRDPISELPSLWKIVYTTSQANKLKSLFLQNNTGHGIPLQTHRGGTSLKGIGNEPIRFF